MSVPKSALRAHTKILQYEPDTHLITRVCEFESAYAEAADEIASEHAARLRTRIARRSAKLCWR